MISETIKVKYYIRKDNRKLFFDYKKIAEPGEKAWLIDTIDKTEEFTAAGRYNLAIYFSDGSVLIGKMHPSLVDYYFYPNGKNFKKDEFMTVSDDGTETRKMCGTTFFAFEFSPILNDKNSKFHYRKGFEPYKRALNELTVEELTGSNVNACTPGANYKVWCTALIQLNGWKIPNDYPFKVK